MKQEAKLMIDGWLDSFQSAQMRNKNEDNMVMVSAYDVSTILKDIKKADSDEAVTYIYCSKCNEKIITGVLEHWQRQHGRVK